MPGWVTLIDRPRSTVFAAARRSLTLELASMGAGVVLILLTLAFVVRRSRREAAIQNQRARSWSGLTRALGSAATPAEVADALVLSLAAAFKDAAAVVAFGQADAVPEGGAESALRQARRLIQSTSTLEKIAPLGRDGPNTVLIEREPDLKEAHVFSGRRLNAIHSLPIPDPDGETAGTIALVTAEERLAVERVGPAGLVRRPGRACPGACAAVRPRARARIAAAAQPAARPAPDAQRASSSRATISQAAMPSRSAATGTTPSGGPTGSSSCASAT